MRTVDCSTPVEKDIPQSLEIFIGGYLGLSYSVKLERGCLVYQPYTDGYQPLEALDISPSADEWKAFRQLLFSCNTCGHLFFNLQIKCPAVAKKDLA